MAEADDAAQAAVEAEAPVPTALRMPSGGHYFREASITNSRDLTFDRKAELLEIFREWWPRRVMAEERHNAEAITEAWENYDGRDDAIFALIDTPAPTVAAAVEKVRVLLDRAHCGMRYQDVDSASTISEFLTNGTLDGPWPIARIYQDLLRMTGGRPDLATAEEFDANSWLNNFCAIAGHSMSNRGPCYMEPEAFPEGDPRNEPYGQQLWRALEPWQRDVVRRVAADRGEGERPTVREALGYDLTEEPLVGRENVRAAWLAASAAHPTIAPLRAAE